MSGSPLRDARQCNPSVYSAHGATTRSGQHHVPGNKGGLQVKKKPVVILPVAAALAALSNIPAAQATAANPAQPTSPQPDGTNAAKAQPNLLFKAGDDLLGLIVTRNADGTV